MRLRNLSPDLLFCFKFSTCGAEAAGFKALSDENINVQMISQGASKVNISMIVDDEEADKTVRVLHKAYFA